MYVSSAVPYICLYFLNSFWYYWATTSQYFIYKILMFVVVCSVTSGVEACGNNNRLQQSTSFITVSVQFFNFYSFFRNTKYDTCIHSQLFNVQSIICPTPKLKQLLTHRLWLVTTSATLLLPSSLIKATLR